MKEKTRAFVAITMLALIVMSFSSVIGVQSASAWLFHNDRPASITITPEVDINTIKTQHTFVATVLDDDGCPVKHAKVEWTLNRFSDAVGDIIEADDNGKIDNAYAETYTNHDGTTWITITSTRAGETDVTAYCPKIKDATVHKAFATKYWVDLVPIWPVDAVNKVGSNHTFVTRVVSETTGDGISDVQVRWTIVDNDPAIVFTDYPGDSTIVTITDMNGDASASITQVAPMSGENTIKIEVLYHGLVLFESTVKKTWVSPILVIAKTGAPVVGLGSTVSYAITVQNTGVVSATSVVVTDIIPAGMSYVSSTPEGIVVGDEVTWNLGDMDAGSMMSITLVLQANAAGTWTNVVGVTCAEGVSDEASATTIVELPTISITKTGPAKAGILSSVTYTLTVANIGAYPVTSVVVTDTLPAGMSYVSSTPAGSVAGNVVTWSLGNMAPGATSMITLVLKADAAGTWTDVAIVTCAEGVSDEASATTIVELPSIAITKTGPAKVGLSAPATYSITVKNPGIYQITSVVVTDTLPAGMSYVSSTPAGTVVGNVVTWSLGDMAAGSSKLITLVLKADVAGSWTNVVDVVCAEGVTAQASATTIVELPSIAITKTGPDLAGYLNTATYTITVKNPGIYPLTSVVVTDTLPAGMSYVSSTPAGTVVGNVITWNLGNMAPGATNSITLVLKMNQLGTWTNVVDVISAEGVTAQASKTTEVISLVAFETTLKDTLDPIKIGTQTTYVYNITNEGVAPGSTAYDVSVWFEIPANTTFISASGPVSYTYAAGVVTFANIPELVLHQTMSFKITVQGNAPSYVIAKAYVTASNYPLIVSSEEGTTIYVGS